FSAVCQANNAAAQTGAVVRLDTGGIEPGKTPAGGDQLFGGGRVRWWSIRIRRWAETWLRLVAYRLLQVAATEQDHQRHRTLGIGGQHHTERDVHFDVWRCAVVYPTDKLPALHRFAGQRALCCFPQVPYGLGHRGGYAPDHLPFKYLHNLRTP